jgi:hypothetical protein
MFAWLARLPLPFTAPREAQSLDLTVALSCPKVLLGRLRGHPLSADSVVRANAKVDVAQATQTVLRCEGDANSHDDHRTGRV